MFARITVYLLFVGVFTHEYLEKSADLPQTMRPSRVVRVWWGGIRARMVPTPDLIVGVAVGAFDPTGQEAPMPLIDFGYTDEAPGGNDTLPSVWQCGYYLMVRGVLGHSSGFRPGANVRLQGDTLMATIANYRAYAFNPRDWREAHWTLRIGDLPSRLYIVRVQVGANLLLERREHLSGGVEGAAGGVDTSAWIDTSRSC